MFLLNVGHRWRLADSDEVQAAVFLAAMNNAERLRSWPRTLQRRLLDPQLYLAGLDGSLCTKACARLATYPWFQIQGLPAFDSGSMNRQEWEQQIRHVIPATWSGLPPADIPHACRSAIDFQLAAGCSHVILPSPLITEREDEAQAQAEWLDEGLKIAQQLEVGQPVLATVALLDTVLNDAAFAPAGFLDAVVDQVTSRGDMDGVYILVVSTVLGHPFEAKRNSLRAYLYLSRAFATAGCVTVFTNFADVFGLVCMAVGATGFVTGPSQSLRRLSLLAFRDDSGGKAYPYYYSHRAIGEFLPESELGRIAELGLLRRVRDLTPYSEALFGTLAAGRSAAELTAWAERQNHVTAAHKHFVFRMSSEGRAVQRPTRADREEHVRAWLEDASANVLYLQHRFDKSPVPGRLAPTEDWLMLFDGVTGN